MIPSTTSGNTSCYSREGDFVGDIGDDTRFKTMSVGRKHVELEAQLVGGVLKWR